MEEIHNLFAYDGLKIVQDDTHLAFSVDSLLLADFVQIPKRVKRIADFGCGNGPIILYLSLKTKKPIFGFELQKSACELARKSVALNRVEDQIMIIHQDIKQLHLTYPASYFDVIVSNPPFFKITESSIVNDQVEKTLARHESELPLETLFLQVKRMLSTKGLFFMVHRIDRLQEVFLLASQHGFGVKRLRFVYPIKGKKATMMLLELMNNGSQVGLTLEEPFYILERPTVYSEEMKRIHFFGKKEIE